MSKGTEARAMTFVYFNLVETKVVWGATGKEAGRRGRGLVRGTLLAG